MKKGILMLAAVLGIVGKGFSNADSTKAKLEFEWAAGTSNSEETESFQLSNYMRLESRNYMLVGAYKNKEIFKNVWLKYGISTGFYNTDYRYNYQSYHNSSHYIARDSFCFTAVVFRPSLGLSHKPFATKKRCSNFQFEGLMGYQWYVPIEASGYEFWSYFQYNNSSLKVSEMNYSFNKLPLSPFFIRLGISNRLKGDKWSKYGVGYRVSWSRNFGSDNSGLNSSSTGNYGYVSSNKKSGLSGVELGVFIN